MHAVVIRRPGGPSVLTWTEVPDAVPGAGEVLIDVAASAVNRGHAHGDGVEDDHREDLG